MADLIAHLMSLTEISRANSNQQRRDAALFTALATSHPDQALQRVEALVALGLAELGEDGRAHSTCDVDGGRWWPVVSERM